jgi:hypothetical protein
MGQISPERRLPDAPITAIRMIVERISDTASPSTETGLVPATGERYRIGVGGEMTIFITPFLAGGCRTAARDLDPSILNQMRYDLRKLKGHGLIERDGPRYATASHQKVSRSRYSSYSSINGCAARSPTAASTIVQIPSTDLKADSKPPITAPTKPSNRSSNFSPPLDSAARQSRSHFVYDRSGKNLA